MYTKSRYVLVAMSSLFTIGMVGAGAVSDTDPQSKATPTSASVSPKSTPEFVGPSPTALSSSLTLDVDHRGAMRYESQDVAALVVGDTVSLSLGNGFAAERYIVESQDRPCERSSWWHLVSIDKELSDATIAIRDGFMTGHIRHAFEGMEWTLRPVSRERVIPTPWTAGHAGCGCHENAGLPERPQNAEGGIAGAGPDEPECSDCTSLVADIVFFYTNTALEGEEKDIEAVGGLAEDAPFTLAASAQLECANTTLTIRNTDLPYSVRVSHVGPTEYDEGEPPTGDDQLAWLLDPFANPSDGIMDDIHPLRDEWAGDNCSLIAENPPSEGFVGLAILNGAFNHLTRSALGGTLHTHEFGHNVGMKHAKGDGPPAEECDESDPDDSCRTPCETLSSENFNYGWRFRGSTTLCFRTVMAYSPGTRILNFSNPDVIFDGSPTGVAIGELQQANGAALFSLNFPRLSARRCDLPEFELDPARLAAAGGQEFDFFGISVAGDESRFVGGASYHNVKGANSGAVYGYVFRPWEEGDPGDAETNPGRWEQTSKLMPDDLRPGDRFGESMALAGDVLLIASPRAGVWETTLDKDGAEIETETVISAGKVTLWEWNEVEESFCLQLSIQPEGLWEFDWFGTSLAINQDFNDPSRYILAVGAPRRDTDLGQINDRGMVYVYEYQSGILTLLNTLEGQFDDGLLGTSVALSQDPLDLHWFLASGAPKASFSQGRVEHWHAFPTDTGQWFANPPLQPGTSSEDTEFGISIAMTHTDLVIGAPAADGNLGRVEAYQRDIGFGWESPQVLTMPGDQEEGRFGTALSLSSDRLAVGAPLRRSPLLPRLGAVFVFEHLVGSSVWIPTDFLRPLGLRAGDELGESVAIAGNLVFAGAPDADDDGILSGVVYALAVQLEDCNDNGIDDSIDIFLGEASDLNANGVPDSCENIGCDADINNDGIVNGVDLGLLLQEWGPVIPGDNGSESADLNLDGVVNGIDVGVFFAAWGFVCEEKP
jgi:hypothetical protein